MITYKLLITCMKENLEFEAQYKEWTERNRYSGMPGDSNYPTKQIEDRKLEVEITEEEFIAVKKAVLETFK